MARFMEFEGNLTADPELTTFDDGNSAVRFRLIDNPTRTNRDTGEVIKDPAVAISCNARGQLARNIARMAKGDRLLVSGTWKTRTYTTDQGEERSTDFLEVTAAGRSLRFAHVTKANGADA